MHVSARVTRAHMLAQAWLVEMGICIEPEVEDRVATQFLIAELINAMEGLDFKGQELE